MFVIYNRQRPGYYVGTISAFVPGMDEMLTPNMAEEIEGAGKFETYADAVTWRDETLQPHVRPHLEIIGLCVVCETALGLPEGYGSSGMCGPCCTGEADTLAEKGETW